MLGDAGSLNASRVAALVADACDWDARWLERVGFLVRANDLAADRSMFDLALELARRAPDATVDHALWLHGHDLPTKRPEWAGELLALLLQRALCQARHADQAHPLVRNSALEHDHTAQQYVVDLGRHGARQLVSAALSWLLEVAERDVEINGPASSYADGRVVDHVWGHRLPGALHDFSDLLLDALEHALASVAAQEPEAAAPIVERLAASELDVAQLLLYRTISGNPERFAERAAHELISDERRLRSGYTGHPYWVTRELIQAISPALSDQSFARLEERLMAWTPAWERRAEARLYRGSAQQELLSAMQAERLSGVARRRLGELARKLGSAEREPPQGVQSGFITSPIGMDAARHMSDEQWLVAIEKHRLDWLDKRGSGFVGGADQLASVFAQLAKEQPKRFVHLALRIGSDAPASYLDDLLLALLQPAAEAEEAPDDAVFALVRHVAAMSDRPGARWIGQLVATRADHDIPDDVLDIVIAAAAHPSPDEDLWAEPAPSGDTWYRGDPWLHGMNTVRGSAAQALGRLVWPRVDRVPKLLPAIQALATDRIAAVRTCAAEALGGLMRWERAVALDLAIGLADTDDRAVAARPVIELLLAYLPTDWPKVEPIVLRLLASEHESAQRAGAVLACRAALQLAEAAEILEGCLGNPTQAVRETVAGVLSANLSGSSYTTMCARGLRRLFDDDSADVRRAAVGSLWNLHREDPHEFEALARALLDSKALREGREPLLHALRDSTVQVADVVVALAERAIHEMQDLGDMRTAAARDGKDLSELLIRILSDEASDEALEDRALELLDQLAAAGAWGVIDVMDSVDR